MADGWFGPLCRGRFPGRQSWGALTVRDSRRSAEHEDLDLCAAISGRSDLQDRDRRLSLHRRHRSPAYLAAWLIIPGEGEKTSIAHGIRGKKLNA
jgi:hypothetical protein